MGAGWETTLHAVAAILRMREPSLTFAPWFWSASIPYKLG